MQLTGMRAKKHTGIVIALILRICGVLVFFTALTACSPVKLPATKNYTLVAGKTADTGAVKSGHFTVNLPIQASYTKACTAMQKKQVLLISVPTALPAYASTRMAYEPAPYQISYYTENRWIATPAELLQTLLLEYLQQQNCYYAVVATPYTGIADYRLETKILDFKQNVIHSPNTIELNLEFTLFNSKNQMLISTYHVQKILPTASNTPYGGVLAINQAIDAILPDLAHWLMQQKMQ